MASVLKKVFAPLALALTLVGCAESPQDVAARPGIIDAMVTNSATVCNKGPVNPDSSAYATRLRAVLDNNSTAALRDMHNHNVTVCLDQRLANQNLGFWDSQVRAAYYSNGDGSSVLSLRDDGRSPQEETFWTGSARNWDATAIRKLSSAFQNGNVTPQDKLLYARTGSCGKNCTTVYWRSPADFSQGTQQKNPELAHPPVSLTQLPPKPAS